MTARCKMLQLKKEQKINLIVLGLIAFIVFPLYTVIFLSLENPILHSITEMGFDMGYYGLFLAWGLFVSAFIMYSFLMTLKDSSFRKELKIALLAVLVVVDILFILTGACSDNPNVVNDTVIAIHNKSAIAMFVGHFIFIGLVGIFSFFRSKLQGFINVTFLGFLLITLFYSYARVNTKESFSLGQAATALSEGYAFGLIVIFMFINYAGTVLLPATGKNKLIAPKTGKII